MAKYGEYVQTEKGFVYERENADHFFEWEKVEIDFKSNQTFAWGRNESFAIEKHAERETAVARFFEWVTETKQTVSSCNS